MSDPSLLALRQRLRAGMTAELRREIETTVESRRERTAGHSDWGLLCEEAGLLNLALREFQLALRDEPGHPVASFRLAQHYRERGEPVRAAELLGALLVREPARLEWLAAYLAVLVEEGALPRARQALERAVKAGLDPARAQALASTLTAAGEEPAPDEQPLTPEDADLVRFQALFAGREDVHARQWVRPNGESGYSPVTEPLTPAVVRTHLLGTCTVGVYPIRLDGTCTFFALDLDLDRSALEQARGQQARARQLRDTLHGEGLRLLKVLRELGLAPLFEDSGYKGRHYWCFLEQPEPAAVLHRLGKLILARQGPVLPQGLHLEFFPKQGRLEGGGLGNLIKLPLGIHRRTGRRTVLLDDRGRPLDRQLATLRQVRRLPRAELYRVIEQLKAQPVPAPAPAPPTARSKGTDPPPVAPAAGPAPPAAPPAWTEADFQADPRFHHLLQRCPVLVELKRKVAEHRQLSHEEQLVLIHTLGHLEGGPQAVNYLLHQCVDVGPEKLLQGQLRGNPVSCPSIRKKIGHITRRVACNCSFDFAPDRYPTPVLHLLTLKVKQPEPKPAAISPDLETLARRFGVLEQRRQEIEREHQELLQALIAALRGLPDRVLPCPGGRYRLVEQEGAEELVWEAD